jgi:uncharacterized Zn finger protein
VWRCASVVERPPHNEFQLAGRLIVEPCPRVKVNIAPGPVSTPTSSSPTWSALAKAYEKLDPLAVLPVYTRLVERELTDTDPRNYRSAARWLTKMRKLAAGSSKSAEIDELIADLRDRYRRRPRLHLEFDRTGLP